MNLLQTIEKIDYHQFVRELEASVPEEFHNQITDYVFCGRTPKPFIEYFLTNDLYGALACGIPYTCYQDIFLFILRCLPRECFGNRAIMADWIELHEQNRGA